MRFVLPLLIAACALLGGPPVCAQTITEVSVAAHEAFLASDALQGRGSATRDEQVAAAYVASEFQSYGLSPAPGMSSYIQAAPVVRTRLTGAPSLSIGGEPGIAATVLISSGAAITGRLAVTRSGDPSSLPGGDVVLIDADGAAPLALYAAAAAKHVKLLICVGGGTADTLVTQFGGRPRLPIHLQDHAAADAPTTLVFIGRDRADALARSAGASVTLTVPTTTEQTVTTNAIGYLAGEDPAAGVLLLTAHLDHLGLRPDGVMMHGANDDASGVTAVLELAQALAARKRPKRGILFVCYGGEEVGGLGSSWFGAHPPVPLADIVANIEFEMIGAQDPTLPAGSLMMTGMERSDLGSLLQAHGARIAGDPYPDEHFFERSDNYALALRGVVAHTVSGWAVTPTYHQPSDTVANLNLRFMTEAIRSLLVPIERLAGSTYKPTWREGLRPHR